MKPPIFIIGSPRSGTTLLRLMLTCHPNIVIPPECGFAMWWYDKYKDWPDGASWNELMTDLMSSREIETWHIDEDGLRQFLRQMKPLSYAALVSRIYEWYGLSRGQPFERWGAKDNFHVEHIGTLRALFPDAAFIHIVRDGRDVACSYRELNARKIDSPWAPKLPNSIEEIAEEWGRNLATATEALCAGDLQNVCEVRFEDLVIHTEHTLKVLCNELGEDYDATMLDYHTINREQELEPKELLKWKEKTLLPPDKTVVGRYKRDLSAGDIKAFEAVAGKTLRNYGYEEGTMQSMPEWAAS